MVIIDFHIEKLCVCKVADKYLVYLFADMVHGRNYQRNPLDIVHFDNASRYRVGGTSTTRQCFPSHWDANGVQPIT